VTDAVRPEGSAFRGFRLVSLLTLASRILGMVRDVVMAAAFGASPVMDAFSVAFRIPNLARRLFGEGAQTSAFLPAFVRMQEQQGSEAAKRLAGGMFGALATLLTGLVVMAGAALGLVRLTAPLSPNAALLVELLLILIPYVIFICLAAQQSAVLHALRRFGWPSLLPIVLNLLWLGAIPVVFAATSLPEQRMRWLCVAILAAGVVQLAIPAVVLRRAGFPLIAREELFGPAVRGIFRGMAPILVGVTITQINTVFDSLLAWALSVGDSGSAGALTAWLPRLPGGTASALYFGQRMYQFPLGIIGVALGTVLFPLLTRHAERGERGQLRENLTAGLGLTLSIGIPAGVGLMILARPITALLFEHGEFTAEDAGLTSGMIVAYGAAVWAFIALLVLQRGYYAVGDRMTPVYHGLAAVAVNLVLDVGLLFPLGSVGLAWATTIAAIVQAGLSMHGLDRRLGPLPWKTILLTLLKTTVATAAMAAACRFTMLPGGDSLRERLLATIVPMSAGVATYFAVAWLVRLREPWRLIRHGGV
jgi:putative peptidoglycan lipid II flippase